MENDAAAEGWCLVADMTFIRLNSPLQHRRTMGDFWSQMWPKLTLNLPLLERRTKVVTPEKISTGFSASDQKERIRKKVFAQC